MSDPPLCRDCRHIDWLSWVAPLCAHPNADVAPGRDLVEGRTDIRVLRRCCFMRAAAESCGPDGAMFERGSARGALLDGQAEVAPDRPITIP